MPHAKGGTAACARLAPGTLLHSRLCVRLVRVEQRGRAPPLPPLARAAQNVYEIPNPGPVARLEILKYHSRNKKLEDETVLTKVAEVTQVCRGSCERTIRSVVLKSVIGLEYGIEG